MMCYIDKRTGIDLTSRREKNVLVRIIRTQGRGPLTTRELLPCIVNLSGSSGHREESLDARADLTHQTNLFGSSEHGGSLWIHVQT